jgi:hypothetical protein
MSNSLTPAQKDALRALGIGDDVIDLLTPENADKAIKFLTPEHVRKIYSNDNKARETNNANQPPSESNNKVVRLAERAQEVLEITELEPRYNTFVGKRINLDGTIEQRPLATEWRQRVVRVAAETRQLHIYLREAREQNIILIPGAPANLQRLVTRKWIATDERSDEHGPHGFLDEPTHVFFMDGDGIEISWRANPEHAVRTVVARLGEPWVSASYVWFLSATCGLECDVIERDGKKIKHWTGKIVDDKLRMRLAFLTDRALNQSERTALTNIARARIPKFDVSICRTVQPNYIQRPLWVENPHRDVLGDTPTIGWVEGAHDRLVVPDHLPHTARWAKAQGLNSDIAYHPDTESAVQGIVRNIGSGDEVYSHLRAAVQHLLVANPIPEHVSFDDHSNAIVSKLQKMIELRHTEVFGSSRRLQGKHLPDAVRWAIWLLEHPVALRAKTIKLSKEEWTEKTNETRATIRARVARVIEQARIRAANATRVINPEATPGVQDVELLVAPTGGGKSLGVRTAAVRFVTEHPGKTVVVLVPYHKLSGEQVELLQKEHSDANFKAAIWRGRHADNPNDPDPKHPGKFLPMCHRSEEVKDVEKAMLDVEITLCKRGRGEKAVKCPLYDMCAFQRQKTIKANIWFAAHECAVHEIPKAFGVVAWVIFDENPLDAFMFGIDIDDRVTLVLDTLRAPPPIDRTKLSDGLYSYLSDARRAVYDALDLLVMETGSQQGVPVPRENLKPFILKPWYIDGMYVKDRADYPPRDMRALTWRGKVDPGIRPDTPKEELKNKLEAASSNAEIKKEVRLWELIETIGNHEVYGRIQLHRDKENGRFVRMVGLNKLATGWQVPTLICDATGDIELLKPIWPQLKESEPHGWEQLPRPPNVRRLQCVNRTFSKKAIAVEGKDLKTTSAQQDLERRTKSARRVYAAVLMRALEYGGADVGVITYKSTEEWIEKNCFVPEWLKLLHWGSVAGTNALQHVRALFVIGRPLATEEAMTRQAEALFGVYIPQRGYVTRREHIPIVPAPEGYNTIWVELLKHPHPMAERLRRQVTKGGIIQAEGRARAGLREAGEPLDIQLWTDEPVPELGPVEPVLRDELEIGPDGLMLTQGAWLRNIPDAARAFEGLFTVDALKKARARESRMNEASPALIRAFYQRAGAGSKPTDAMFLKGIADPQGQLEKWLGPLAWFEMEGKNEAM